MNDKRQKNLKFTEQLFVVRVKSARINVTKVYALYILYEIDHQFSDYLLFCLLISLSAESGNLAKNTEDENAVEDCSHGRNS